jgi:hypothetical protein
LNGDEVLTKTKVQDLTILKMLLSDNAIAIALIDKAMFMEKTLKELEKQIETDGTITEMCQGSTVLQEQILHYRLITTR